MAINTENKTETQASIEPRHKAESLTCEICEADCAACGHYRLVGLLDSKLKSADFDSFDASVRRLKIFIEHGIRTFVASEGLHLAEKFYTKAGIIDRWREERRRNNEEWTAEELEEFAEIERDERENLIADYTPPTAACGASRQSKISRLTSPKISMTIWKFR